MSLGSNLENLPTPTATEERKVLVISFNFLNDKNNPYTNPQLEQMILSGHNSTRNYYLDSSYQKLNLVGTVVGPFTIPFNQKEQSCYDYQTWAIAADALAYASGVDINEYHTTKSIPSLVPTTAGLAPGPILAASRVDPIYLVLLATQPLRTNSDTTSVYITPTSLIAQPV